MKPVHQNVVVLPNYPTHGGMSPADLLVEYQTVSMASGVATCPTIFEDGYVVNVQVTRSDGTGTGSFGGYAVKKQVISGAITIYGAATENSTLDVVIVGRPKI